MTLVGISDNIIQYIFCSKLDLCKVTLNIRKNIYKLIDNYTKLHYLSLALRFVNMNKFPAISNNLKNKTRFYQKILTEVTLDEEKIFSQNYEAFKVMKKRLLDHVSLYLLRKTMSE